MLRIKLTWVPSGQVFASPRAFESAIGEAATRVLRAGYRSFNVTAMDDGVSFEVSGLVLEQGHDIVKYVPLVSAALEAKAHPLTGTDKNTLAPQRSELQSIRGKVPASGWYKGHGRRFSHTADPRHGPYFLVMVDAGDTVVGEVDLRPAMKTAEEKGVEYPLDVALAGLNLADHTEAATFVLVLRDDNPPKLRFNQKWDPAEGPRSMQVVYRRPLVRQGYAWKQPAQNCAAN